MKRYVRQKFRLTANHNLKRFAALFLCMCVILSGFGGIVLAYEKDAVPQTNTDSYGNEVNAERQSEYISKKEYEAGAPEAFIVTDANIEFNRDDVPYWSFRIKMPGKEITTPSRDWSYKSGSIYKDDGTIDSAKFPQIDGYTLASVTYLGVELKHLGTINDRSGKLAKAYTYYSTSDTLNEYTISLMRSGDTITLNYEPIDYNITYEVTGADNTDIDEDYVFGKKRMTATSNKKMNIEVNIPYGYTGEVRINDEIAYPDGSNSLKYNLGTEPVYKQVSTGAAVDTSKGPEKFTLSGTYSRSNINTDQKVSVKLQKRSNPTSDYYFDPSLWLNSTDVKNKLETNVKTRQNMSNLNNDGSFSYQWVFDTKIDDSSHISWMLESLEINGENVAVPFYENIVTNSPTKMETVLSSGTKIIVTLNSMTREGLFSYPDYTFLSYGRKYTIRAENSYQNIVITGGKLAKVKNADDYNEMIMSKAYGVEKLQYYIRNSSGGSWVDKKQSDVTKTSRSYAPQNGTLALGKYSEDTQFKGNVRFKMMDGFNAPNFCSFSDTRFRLYPNKRVSGPDSEGWYYLQLDHSLDARITTLQIIGVQKKYILKYHTGKTTEGTVANMPEFNNGNLKYNDGLVTDANGGDYYSFDTGSTVFRGYDDIVMPDALENVSDLLSEFIPDTFSGWSLTNESGNTLTLDAGSHTSINELSKYSTLLTGYTDTYVINITPVWQSNKFVYYSDFVWTNPDGTDNSDKVSSERIVIPDRNKKAQNREMRFFINNGSEVITKWLNSHPGFKFVPSAENVVFVGENEKLTTKFTAVKASLSVKKTVLQSMEETALSTREFPFELILKYPSGTTNGYGINVSGQNLSSEYDGAYNYTLSSGTDNSDKRTGTINISNGRGTFNLKSDETIVFDDLPDGVAYEVNEITPDGYNAVYDEHKTGILSSSQTASTAVTNRRVVALTVKKTVIGDIGDLKKDWNFSVKITPPAGITLNDYLEVSGKQGENKIAVTKGSNGEYTGEFTLKHGENITILNLPVGTKYEITEKDANQYGHKTSVTGAEECKDGTATGTLRDAQAINGAIVSFINASHAGNLNISKAVYGNGAKGKRAFNFIIELTPQSGKTLNDTYEYIDSSDGKTKTLTFSNMLGSNKGAKTASVTLNHGQTVTVLNIPTDTTYTVTELPVNNITPAYTTMVKTGDNEPVLSSTTTGTIPTAEGDDAEDVNITFINSRDVENGLVIENSVVNGNESEPTAQQREQESDVTVTFRDETGAELTESYSYTGGAAGGETLGMIKSGDTIKLRHDGRITVEGLPEGTTYTVTATPTNGFSVSYPDKNTGKLEDKPVIVRIVNVADTGALSISKTVSGSKAVKESEFEVTVSLTDADGIALNGKYDYTGSKTGKISNGGVLNLNNGDSIELTGLPVGTKYFVNETQTAGYTVSYLQNNNGSITKDGATVNIVNTVITNDLAIHKVISDESVNSNKDFVLTVKLTDSEGIPLTSSYSYEISGGSQNDDTISGTIENGIGTVSIKNGQTATVKDLPYGTNFTVTEDSHSGYTVSYTPKNGSGTILDDDVEVFVTNSPIPNYDLTVMNTVTGSGSNLNDKFEFVVNMTVPEGMAENEDSFTFTGPGNDSGTLTKDGNVWIADPPIMLGSGQSIIIKGLPVGTKYSIAEINANEDGYTMTSVNDVGTINSDDGDVTAEFTNTRRTELVIGKLVTSANIYDTDESFTFNILLTAKNGTELAESYPYIIGTEEEHQEGTIKFTKTEDGGYTGSIKLKNKQGVRILDLPDGTSFSITESENGRYKIMSYDDTGTIYATPEDYFKMAVFQNEWFTPETNLTVRKTVIGELSDKEKSWNFTLSLKAPEGVTLADSYDLIDAYGIMSTLELTDDNGFKTGSFSLKHNQNITIVSLPVGTEYTITEVEANSGGYITSVSGADRDNSGVAEGVLTDEQVINGAVVTFTNANHAGNLIISKTVEGNGGNRFRGFDFIVTLTPPENVVLDEGYTYIDSLTGEEGYLVLTSNGESKTGTVSLRHGDAVIIQGIPAGTSYTVSEEQIYDLTPSYETSYRIDNSDVKPGFSASGVIPPAAGEEAGNAEVSFINTRHNSNTLTISKTVKGIGAETDREFTFTVSLTNQSGNALTDSFIYTGSKYGIIENGSSVTLKHGESITIQHLPEGTKYTVTESDSAGYITESSGTTGTITEDADAEFVNTRTYTSIVLTKVQYINGAKAESEASVKRGDKLTYYITASNTGNAMAGNVVIYDDIPKGLELDEDSVSGSGKLSNGVLIWNLGDMEAGESRTVSFTVTVPDVSEETSWKNTARAEYDNPPEDAENPGEPVKTVSDIMKATFNPGNLCIKNTVTGSAGETNKEFTFTLTLTDSNGNVITDIFNYSGSKSGIISSGGSITLKHGESITVTGLYDGIKYSVTESGSDGYTVTKTGDVGQITAGGTSTASFVNNKGQGSNPGGDTDPTNPGGDTDPTKPGGDTDPTKPGGDTDPTKPGGDTDPTKPGGDTDPTKPGGDTDPANPGGSTDPTNPGGDTDPTNPGESTDPTKPGGSTDPANPGGSTDPTTPGGNTNSTNPTVKPNVPKTGDNYRAEFYLTLMLAALFAVTVTVVISKRKRRF